PNEIWKIFKMIIRHFIGTFALLLATTTLAAAENAFTIERTLAGGVEVKLNGKPFAGYVVDQANKPYLWPVYGPTGKSMTRAYPMQQVEGEQHDHPHHRGITFGHEGINDGVDTWAERLTFEELLKEQAKSAAKWQQRLTLVATEKHREYTELKAD